jgi:hypothetical protein
VVCVHPGGPRNVGTLAIRSAFEAVFAGGRIPAHPEQVHKVHTVDSAMHSVLERIDLVTPEGPRTGWVIATNVYLRGPQGWRLVAHHASPGQIPRYRCARLRGWNANGLAAAVSSDRLSITAGTTASRPRALGTSTPSASTGCPTTGSTPSARRRCGPACATSTGATPTTPAPAR